ncbi:MAG: hypothetical protein HY903_05670 [Deltaproteobacteria bacterium]|nr:hypothetical protein [Deltaproteobacteria bacterium]
MEIEFRANASLAQVRADLQARGYSPAQIETALQGVELKDGYLVRELTLDLAPAAPAGPTALPAPVPPSREEQASLAEKAAKKTALEKLVDKEVVKAAATELKKSFKLGDNVIVEVQNRVLSSSTEETQQAFLAAHPQGRILTTTIKVSGDTADTLKIGGAVSGNLKGAYEIQVELPFKDFKGTTWQSQLATIQERLLPICKLARLSSDKFWAEVQKLGEPAGTRIVRTFEVGGGAKLAADDLSADLSRTTRVTFETKWTAPKTVTVSVDTLRTDTAGLGLTLGKVGGEGGLSASNHQTHTYVGLYVGIEGDADLDALKEAISWGNGLIPKKIDTDLLDGREKGSLAVDVMIAKRGGANVYLPIGTTLGLSGGGSIADTKRVTVRVPDHTGEHRLVSAAEAQKWAAAMATTDVAVLTDPAQVIPELVVQRVGTGEQSAQLGATLVKGAQLVPGWAGVGAVLSFANTVSEEDVVGTKIEYTSPEEVAVTLWKIDTKRIAAQLGLDVGISIDAAVKTKIADALAAHLFKGDTLQSFADDIGDLGDKELRHLAEAMKLRLSYSHAATTYGFESLRFADLNLRSASDRATLAALAGNLTGPRDAEAVALAVQNGQLSEAILRAQDEVKSGFAAKLGGLTLLSLSSSDFAATDEQRVKLSDKVVDGKRVEEWVYVKMVSAGATRQTAGLTEKYNFDASAFAVSKVLIVDGKKQDPVAVDGLMRISNEVHDKWFRGVERDNIEGVVAAGGYRVSERRVGDGSWWLGWLLGPNFGEVDVKMKGVITGVGGVNVLKADPEVAARTAVYTASRLQGASLPPSESLVLGTGVSTSLESYLHYEHERKNGKPTSDAAAIAITLGSPWVLELEPGKMDKPRRAVRATIAGLDISEPAKQRFAALADAQVDELIYHAVAARMLSRYRDIAETDATADTERQQERDRLRSEYEVVSRDFEGERRDIRSDLWLAEQGVAMRAVFDRDEVQEAKRVLAANRHLSDEQLRVLVQKVFRELAKNYRPAAFGINRDHNREALTFWVSLQTLAGRDAAGQPQGIGLFEVHGKEYDLAALTEGVDAELLERLTRRTGTEAQDKARREAGGPAVLHDPLAPAGKLP